MSANNGTLSPGVYGSITSEFARKLYGMLEDPANQDVARWGKDGDTFIIVENEQLIRSILCKYFKHRNITSFIRQLNKYGFHKVRQTNDIDFMADSAPILEFKHPSFIVGRQDDLCKIRLKAPASGRTQAGEDITTSHHIAIITEQLIATQQQVQQLQELLNRVSLSNRHLKVPAPQLINTEIQENSHISTIPAMALAWPS
ncbi:hypothetical protein HG530_015884 [Fusarium avenaceum]|nr:hypothetical protein HG530_015884 [Fusarium avenaceum]